MVSFGFVILHSQKGNTHNTNVMYFLCFLSLWETFFLFLPTCNIKLRNNRLFLRKISSCQTVSFLQFFILSKYSWFYNIYSVIYMNNIHVCIIQILYWISQLKLVYIIVLNVLHSYNSYIDVTVLLIQ